MIFYLDGLGNSNISYTQTTFRIYDTLTHDPLEALLAETSTTNHNFHILTQTLVTGQTYYIEAERVATDGTIYSFGPQPFIYNATSSAQIEVNRIERPVLNITGTLTANALTVHVSSIRPQVPHTHTMYTILDQHGRIVYHKVTNDPAELSQITLTQSDTVVGVAGTLANATSLDIRVAQGSNGVFSPIAQYKTEGNANRPVITESLDNIVPVLGFKANVSTSYTLAYGTLHEGVSYVGEVGITGQSFSIPINYLLYGRDYVLTLHFIDGARTLEFQYILSTVSVNSRLTINPNVNYINTVTSTANRGIGLLRTGVIPGQGVVAYTANGYLLIDGVVNNLTPQSIPGVTHITVIGNNSMLVHGVNGTQFYSISSSGFAFAYGNNIVLQAGEVPYPTSDGTSIIYITSTGDVKKVDMINNTTVTLTNLGTMNNYSIAALNFDSYIISVNTVVGFASYVYYETTNSFDTLPVDIDLSEALPARTADGAVRFFTADNTNAKMHLFKDNVFTSNIMTIPNTSALVLVTELADTTVYLEDSTDAWIYE